MRDMPSWCLMSKLDVGSSRSSTSGCWTSPLANMTFWCCPAESSLKYLMARSWMPSFSKVSYTTSRSCSVVLHPVCGCLPRSTVSTTVRGNESDEVQGT